MYALIYLLDSSKKGCSQPHPNHPLPKKNFKNSRNQTLPHEKGVTKLPTNRIPPPSVQKKKKKKHINLCYFPTNLLPITNHVPSTHRQTDKQT